ncbi:hypothetical protein C8024_10715 [Sphingopyxis sp. BSNA05]|nr:hypothetical protein CHN51_13545 [Sphingorhabdus sp. YGSMI21]NRD89823.1 hypothetical protein [Sphingopyxis sp. BSNA05]
MLAFAILGTAKEQNMEKHGDQIEVTEREASNKPRASHNVRIVLAASLLLAVIVMSMAWIIPALS